MPWGRFVVTVWLAACVSSDAVICPSGLVCPAGTVCATLTNPDGEVCALQAQLDACEAKQPFDACSLSGSPTARCYDGVCIAAGCGNRRFDPGEQCDDGNTGGGDGCAADCLSDETCGNNVVDLIGGETCDDGNYLDHDSCTSVCRTEQLRWFERSLRPPPRQSGMAAYDPRRDRIVMFGGNNGPNRLTDTYEWDRIGWVRHIGFEPPPRASGAMAFDGQRVILYGGDGLSDTWAFDGTSWTPLLVPGPGPRQFHAMAYDANRDRIVMFGDLDATRWDQTWEWDGTTWTQATPATSPPGRAGAMLAYDPIRRVVVLAGGNASTSMTDTWEYDGVTWRDVTPPGGAPSILRGAMAFDAGAGQVIAFGGTTTTDTLAWNGTQWTNLGSTGAPSRRSAPQLASTGDRVVLFGGKDLTTSTDQNDTWNFEAGAWTPARLPGPRDRPTIERDVARGQILVYGGTVTGLGGTDETWLLTTNGWRQHTTAPLPPARSAHAMTYDFATNTIVMFGGFDGGAPYGETWIWNGSWTQATTGTAPAARNLAIMAFDGTGVTLFGGVVPGVGATNDTWRWNGSTWTQASPMTVPPRNQGACAIYDPVREHMVVVGGSNGGTATWSYDGVDWTNHVAVTHPGGCDAIAWNPARQAVVVQTNFALWEWNGSAWSVLSPADPGPAHPGEMTTAVDGAGVVFYGSHYDAQTGTPYDDATWELRWQGSSISERCDGADLDLDRLVHCDDPDCWWACTPACPPGTSCSSAETCPGDCP